MRQTRYSFLSFQDSGFNSSRTRMMNTTTLNGILLVICVSATFAGDTVTLSILHINDFNGHTSGFQPQAFSWSKPPGRCHSRSNCIGGLKPLVHWLFENKTFFDDAPLPSNNIRISSGNLISQGSDLEILLAQQDTHDHAALHLWDYMQLTAVALGSKEFTMGFEKLTKWAQGFPNNTIVLANTCEEIYNGTEKSFCTKISPFRRVELITDDRHTSYTIGIVGFAEPKIQNLYSPGKLQISDPASVLNDITSPVADIQFFIAIGEGDIQTAKQILETAPKIKLVILSNGLPSTTTFPEHRYPLEYKQGYILSAGAYGSSVGKLQMQLNTKTHTVESIKGKLQIVTTPQKYNAQSMRRVYFENSRYPQSMTSRIENYFRSINRDKLAFTRVDIQGGEICWQKECSLGNLMTTAVARCVEKNVPIIIPHPIHAIWYSGAFASHPVYNGGTITWYDLYKMLPARDEIHLVKILGTDLWRLFETSATMIGHKYSEVVDWRQFLQVSKSMKIHYDTSQDTPRLSRIELFHNVNGVPRFLDIDTKLYYHVAIPTFLYEGKGVFNYTRDIWTDAHLGVGVPSKFGNDIDCLKSYMTKYKTVEAGIEERIKFVGRTTQETSSCGFEIFLSILVSTAFSVIVIVIIYKTHFVALVGLPVHFQKTARYSP